MTITDFTTLTLPEQLDILCSEGVYLSKRRSGDEIVILYQLNQLYIEIFYRKYRVVISNIRCSNSTDMLNPYLESIPIDDLFR